MELASSELILLYLELGSGSFDNWPTITTLSLHARDIGRLVTSTSFSCTVSPSTRLTNSIPMLPVGCSSKMILIKTSFWSETFAISALWPGRIVQLLLGAEHRNLQLLGVHLTSVPPRFSWTQLAARLFEAVSDHQGPSIIIGDFNFVDSPKESTSFETGIPQRHAGVAPNGGDHSLVPSLSSMRGSPIATSPTNCLRVDLRVLGALGSLSSSTSPTLGGDVSLS